MDIAKQWDELIAHGAGQPTAVPVFEFQRVGEPAQCISKGADRKLDQHLTAGCRIVVTKYLLLFQPDLEPEAHEISLTAIHPSSGLQLSLIQDIAGIEIAKPHAPRMPT